MWFLIGLIAGAFILGFVFWAKGRNLTLRWYEWLVGGLGFALLLFAIQNFTGSLSEFETTAAWMMILFLGVPALILLIVAWQLYAHRQGTE